MQSTMERRQSCFNTQRKMYICGVRKKSRADEYLYHNIRECVPQKGTHRTINI